MAKTKILMVTSECTPYASTGGLADVCGALPTAMYQEGFEVDRIMPLYKTIVDQGFDLTNTNTTLLPEVTRYEKKHPFGTDYFVAHDPSFWRDQLYGNGNIDYPDNFERFTLFQHAVVSHIEQLSYNLVHLNDWQTGLIPWMLKRKGRGEVTLLTLHNLAYQGLFPFENLTKLTKVVSEQDRADLTIWDQVNMLKSGILLADHISTVSPSYSKEIQTKEFGCGLQDLLKSRADTISGMLNGADYTIWNPETDILIPDNYSCRQMQGKATCKKVLQEKMALPVDPNTPVFAMVARLTEQKGVDLLIEALYELHHLDIQWVVLGTGDILLQKKLLTYAKKNPQKMALTLGFDRALAHEITAGADFFLMPSRFEPCGLSQIYSLKYGTVPIVTPVGGLKDTIIDVRKNPAKATGVMMQMVNASSLVQSIEYAEGLFQQPLYKIIQENGMKQDFSWGPPAKAYKKLYNSLIRKEISHSINPDTR